jgi:CubicO group peptidase (beta-lactamase class C family)
MRVHADVLCRARRLAGSLSAQATRPDPSRIERGLRTLVRVAGREDSTFDIRDRMRQYHVPGLSIAVVDGDRVVWARGYGVMEFGKSEPVDTSTLFLAGSISKPVFRVRGAGARRAGQARPR